MDLKATYDLIAEDWYKDHHHDDWWTEGVEKFISLLPPQASVLDVGCGAGTKSAYLASRGLRVTGIDFSKNLIAIAKRDVSDATFQVLDIREVHELKEPYEGVFMQAALLHFPKKEALHILQSLTEKIVQGGILYVAVKEVREGQADEQILTENDYGYPYERFFSYYSQSEIEEYFQKLKLQIVFSKIVKVGDTNWIQVIGKK